MSNKAIKPLILKDMTYAMNELERIKKEEARLANERGQIETWIIKVCACEDNGKTTFVDENGNEIVSITNSISYKVDPEKLDAIAKENGLEIQVPFLFRFKAEVNTANWNAANDEIKAAFAPAVTAKADKPSISSNALIASIKEYKQNLKENN